MVFKTLVNYKYTFDRPVTHARSRYTDFPVFAFAPRSVIPQFPFGSWRDISSSDHEVAEMLVLEAFERIPLDHGLEDGQDLGFGHGFAVYLVESLTVVPAPEKHRVAAWSLSDERHLCAKKNVNKKKETTMV